MWLLACSRAGLHIPMEMSPSLRLTLLPPNALIRDETGRLMNENTDLPALETCPIQGVQSTEHRNQITMYLLPFTYNLSPLAIIRHFKIGYKSTTFFSIVQILFAYVIFFL